MKNIVLSLLLGLSARALAQDQSIAVEAFKSDQGFIDSNCKAKSHKPEVSGVMMAFRTMPPTNRAGEAFESDFPLEHCLAEIRLAILSQLGEPNGSVRMDDHGTVEFGEKGALTQCGYQIEQNSRVREDLMKKILKYEGVLPKDPEDDPLENFSPDKIHGWSKAVEDIVIIDCLVS